jgi:outer membrane protein TolC
MLVLSRKKLRNYPLLAVMVCGCAADPRKDYQQSTPAIPSKRLASAPQIAPIHQAISVNQKAIDPAKDTLVDPIVCVSNEFANGISSLLSSRVIPSQQKAVSGFEGENVDNLIAADIGTQQGSRTRQGSRTEENPGGMSGSEERFQTQELPGRDDNRLVDVVVVTATMQESPTSDFSRHDDAEASTNRNDSTEINLASVINSIHETFPLLEAAYQQGRIAEGNRIAAWGSFDTKIEASSGSLPLGYYETYQNQVGLSQPIFDGGSVFGGYRIGRGSYQPWYLERQTNDGGEISAGVSVPLMRNREIDARRAGLWRANYDRQIAVPEIQSQLLHFVRDGSVAFWEWVKAGRKFEIGENALSLVNARNEQIERKVELGELEPPALDDNRRAIAQRQSKLISLRQAKEQYAIKLSMYLRTPDGQPIVLSDDQSAGFPQTFSVDSIDLNRDVESAVLARPEIKALAAQAQRIQVDLSEARNEFLPTVDAQLIGSQDLGEASSSKRDKSEFELEARLLFELPVQRRKAHGKTLAAQGKLAQLDAKQRFVEDKIRTELRVAYAALKAAAERLELATESQQLAELLAEVERRKLEVGETDLLAVALREQIAIEAAEATVDSEFDFFAAKADYDAAMARDRPNTASDSN